ncbi:MAG: helix-turn-helix domain-containing protein [Verrucomicrobia bacterium]|nr:helix-turn-helix domain-containing protein [Verrucomicrobiota bacterium]
MRSETTSENRLLSENELLSRLPISRRTLYALRREGRLPFIKLTRRVLYDWESVRGALLSNQRRGTVLTLANSQRRKVE